MNRTVIRRLLLPGLLATAALLLAGCGGTPARHATPDAASSAQGTATIDDPLRLKVVSSALQTLGTPYRYGGKHPGGFDCSGLVHYTHHRAGVSVPRVAREQQRHARPVSLNGLRPGDLLFFELEGKNEHVGIYIGQGEFIHAPSSGKRVSRTRLDDPYWRDRLVATGSYL